MKIIKILGIICKLKTIYYTLGSRWFFEGVEISGHDFIEQEDGTLKCKVCGHVSI